MSDSIGKVFLDLETNATPFQQQLNGIAGKSTNMVTSAFKKMGKAFLAAFAVKKLYQFGKASIEMASDLQEVQNVVDVVFGESSSQIDKFAKTALNAYGLSELSAKKYASTMGAMLKSMGLSDQATLNMSQSITALTGDMASFYNLDSDAAFQKIRAGISGETEPLKQLGINMSQANLEAYALSQGITKSYQSMTQAEQALLRYNYLLKTTADAQGDFARTSDSWANQTRILSEQFNSFKATMGSAFIAVLTPVVKMLNWIISKLQIAATYFKAFVSAITGVKAESSSASSGMSEIADSAVEAGEATEKAAKKAKKSLAGFDQLNVLSSNEDSGSDSSGGGAATFEMPDFSMVEMSIPEPDTSGAEKAVGKIKKLFSDLKSYISTAFAPSISAWGQAFANLKAPAADMASSVGASISSLWENTFVPFGAYLLEDFAPTLFNTFSETVAPIFTDVMSFAMEQWALDFSFACEQISNLVNDILLPVMELLKTVTFDVLGSIGAAWDEHGKGLLESFGKFRDGIKEIWNNLYLKIIKPVWDSIISGLSNLWSNHLKPLWDVLLSFFMKLGEAIMTVWNNFLAPIVNWLIDTFGPLVTGVFNAVWEVVQAVFGNFIDAARSILNALGGLLDFIIGVFSGDWNKAWEGIKNFFKGIWDAMVNILKAPINLIIGIINALISAVESVINFVISGLNKLSWTVPDWVPVIGGSTFGFNISPVSLGRIPYLARGGIVDQPTLAMVGEAGKEAVVPLENTAFADSIAHAILKVLTPLFSNGSRIGKNDDGTTVLVLKVGEYELGRVTVGAINKYHNVVGKVELEV